MAADIDLSFFFTREYGLVIITEHTGEIGQGIKTDWGGRKGKSKVTHPE